MKKRAMLSIAAAALFGLVVSCSGGSGSPTAPDPKPFPKSYCAETKVTTPAGYWACVETPNPEPGTFETPAVINGSFEARVQGFLPDTNHGCAVAWYDSTGKKLGASGSCGWVKGEFKVTVSSRPERGEKLRASVDLSDPLKFEPTVETAQLGWYRPSP